MGLEENVWWDYQRSIGSSVWPLTWSNHRYGMWPTSLGPGHPWILFFSGNWLFMDFFILWAPLRCSPLSSASSLALFSPHFSQCHRHWGALLALLLSIFPSSLGFYPPLSIQKIRSIFCCHLFLKSEVAEATYFCPTQFIRFIWYIWPNQIPDYSSFPLN